MLVGEHLPHTQCIFCALLTPRFSAADAAVPHAAHTPATPVGFFPLPLASGAEYPPVDSDDAIEAAKWLSCMKSVLEASGAGAEPVTGRRPRVKPGGYLSMLVGTPEENEEDEEVETSLWGGADGRSGVSVRKRRRVTRLPDANGKFSMTVTDWPRSDVALLGASPFPLGGTPVVPAPLLLGAAPAAAPLLLGEAPAPLLPPAPLMLGALPVSINASITDQLHLIERMMARTTNVRHLPAPWKASDTF